MMAASTASTNTVLSLLARIAMLIGSPSIASPDNISYRVSHNAETLAMPTTPPKAFPSEPSRTKTVGSCQVRHAATSGAGELCNAATVEIGTAAKPAPWAGTLALGPWWLLFGGAFGPTASHHHHAVQIVAADDHIEIEDAAGDRARGDVLVVPADTVHAIVSGPPVATMLFVDADSIVGRDLADSLDGRVYAPRVALRMPSLPAESYLDAEVRVASLLRAVGGVVDPIRRPSPIIRHALDRLPGLTEADATLAAIARTVGLSPSRFTHRFTAEVGIPFRSYRRWLRLLTAVEALSGGATLTEAAHRSGFADSSHLTRTFRAQFGLTPSDALAASRWLPAP